MLTTPLKEQITQPLKAIKAYCYDCSGDSKYEVKRCSSPDCPLKPFRFGKNPFIKRTLTEEQKMKFSERMKNLKKKGDPNE